MKKYSLLSAIFATIFIAAGCQSTSRSVESRIPQEIAPASTVMMHSANPFEQTSESDQVAYYGAQELKDEKYCEKISNTNLKNLCSVNLKDSLTLQKAVQELNTKLCSELSTEDKQKACGFNVEIVMQKKETAEKENADLVKSTEILNAGELSRCSEELKDPDMVAYCEYNIVVNQALEAKDPQKCSQIHDEKRQKLCEETYAVAATE